MKNLLAITRDRVITEGSDPTQEVFLGMCAEAGLSDGERLWEAHLGHSLVACEFKKSGEVVGFAACLPLSVEEAHAHTPLVDEESLPFDPDETVLVRVAIKVRVRRHGLGGSLVRQTLRWAREQGFKSFVILQGDQPMPRRMAFRLGGYHNTLSSGGQEYIWGMISDVFIGEECNH